jgi:hypothetical protein
MLRVVTAFIAILDLFFIANPANAIDAGGLTIVSAHFGRSSGKNWMDVTARLQALCGAGSPSCDIWCMGDTLGTDQHDRHAVCRVIYRCPDASVRSTEAGHNEPILMRCLDVGAADRGIAASAVH